MVNVVISGSGVFTPEHSISNEELVTAFNQHVNDFNSLHETEIEAGEIEPLAYSSSEFIEKASGIKSRHVMHPEGILDPDVMKPKFTKRLAGDKPPEMVEMAIAAAKEALAQANREGHEVDLVICAASNFQRPYPALSVEVQHHIGAQGFGYDMNVACSSATFAIINATQAIKAGNAKVVLVVNPEFASPQLNYRSRDSHFIFGDVCAATIIEAEEGCKSEQAFRVLGSKQLTKFSNNIRCDTSYVDHCMDELSDKTPFFVQEGRKVFKELTPIVSDLVLNFLKELDTQASDLKRMWLHQANIHMNIYVCKKVLGMADVDFDKAPLVLDKYANTASAGSVISFHQNKDDFKPGDKGVMCSFGAGYSIGSIALERI